jgi:hypothetical protein
MFNLQHFAARYRLGLQDSESLVSLADTMMAEGRDTPAVIQLSILEPAVMSDAGPLFERVCEEAGIVIPSKQEAVDELIHFHLKAISSGECKPRLGLETFMRELYRPFIAGELDKEYVGDSRGLEHLIGAYWNYDDLIDRPREVSWDGKYGSKAITAWEHSVQQYASDWLSKNAPSS